MSGVVMDTELQILPRTEPDQHVRLRAAAIAPVLGAEAGVAVVVMGPPPDSIVTPQAGLREMPGPRFAQGVGPRLTLVR